MTYVFPNQHMLNAGVHCTRLGIDAAVGNWNDKPLLYHLRAR